MLNLTTKYMKLYTKTCDYAVHKSVARFAMEIMINVAKDILLDTYNK